MIFKRLALKNVRSFIDGEVDLFDGFHCIIGGVGAGKSTILLAIDFALFGKPLFGPVRGFNYLLRNGARSGRVEFEFEHHGKTYKITRALRREGERVVEDSLELDLSENGKLIARGKEEAVVEEIINTTGLDYKLFRDIVWIQQERLKEIIDLSPGRRRERVDGILGLSDLEMAWEKMRDFERNYEGEIRKIETENPYIPIIDQQRKEYDEIAGRLIETDGEIQSLRLEREGIEREIESHDRELDQLVKAEMRLREWERKRFEVEADIRYRERVLQEITARIEDRKGELKKGIDELGDIELRMRRQWGELGEIGIEPNFDMKGVKGFLQGLRKERSKIESRRDVENELIADLRQKLEGIKRHKRCPTCLQTITSEYRDRILDDLTRKISDIEMRVESYIGTEGKLVELIKRIESISSSLEDQQTRHDILEERIAVAQKELDGEERLLSGHVHGIATLKEKLARVEMEKPEFDPTWVDKIRMEREDLNRRKSRIESELGHLSESKMELAKQMDLIKTRLDRAEKDRKRLYRIQRILKYIREFRELYRKVQPVIRREYVQWLESIVQDILTDVRMGLEPLEIKLDEESYTPIITAGRGEPLILLSGGERTQLALAYRVGLSQLVMDTRGRELDVLIIDEPTASLGKEDMSIVQLAEAISQLKNMRQIIAVTHSEDFASEADHVLEVTKTHSGSQVRVVK